MRVILFISLMVNILFAREMNTLYKNSKVYERFIDEIQSDNQNLKYQVESCRQLVRDQ